MLHQNLIFCPCLDKQNEEETVEKVAEKSKNDNEKTQTEKILDLQKRYSGYGDLYIQNKCHVERPIAEICSELIETRSHIFDPNQKSFTINTTDDFERGYGYHNLRITTDLNHVKKIEFYACGNPIDRSYPSLLKNYTPFAILQENVLPALKNNYEIVVDYKKATQITYHPSNIN